MRTDHRTTFLLSSLALLISIPAFSQVQEFKSPTEMDNAYFGVSLSLVPDVGGDGFDDFAVGSSWNFTETVSPEVQRIHIFNASTGALNLTLSSPNEEMDGFFGFSVSGVQDLNGNGTGDVVVGAFHEDPGSSPLDSGRAYVFDGSNGQMIHTLRSPNEEQGGNFARAIASIGDLNGNGSDEVIVGAAHESPGSSPDSAGRAYVFDGKTGVLIRTLVSPNDQENGNFGNTVGQVPDVNGDGTPDLIVGARQEFPDGSPIQAGRAYLFDGATGNPIRTFLSPHEQDHGTFGTRVAGIPDVNGNGSGDVMVSAIGEGAADIPREAGRVLITLSARNRRRQ